MSEHGTGSPDDDPSDEEYDELVRLIVAAQWHPGDTVRTTKGVTWQFRQMPYTSDFPEANERHAAHKTRTDAFRSWAS